MVVHDSAQQYTKSSIRIGGRFVGKRGSKKLTKLAITNVVEPGYYADGDGLYLQVSGNGTKSWVLHYCLQRRAREMGLGSLKLVSLAEARDLALKYRKLLHGGHDPIQHRQAERESQHAALAQRRTFAQCAVEYHDLHANGWRNAKHAAQWISTLRTYAFPAFGDKEVSGVSKSDVLKALEPIWITKPETASRVRQRIRAVLDWAAARDYRTGHDPNLWDQVARSLPKTGEIKRNKHFAACPYADVPAVLQAIRGSGASDAVKDDWSS